MTFAISFGTSTGAASVGFSTGTGFGFFNGPSSFR